MRAQKKVFKGPPNTPPKSCSVVTDPLVQCEAICDRALNQMLFNEFLFMQVFAHDKVE